MVHRLNPHATLIQQNCETIRVANRVAMREATRQAIRTKAIATVNALETITEELLDEEFAPIGRIKEMVARSGSLRLAQRIVDITGGKLVNDAKTWRIVLVHSDPARIRDLVAGPCTAGNLGLGVLEQVSEGRPEFTPLVAEIAPHDPFADMSTGLIFNNNVPGLTAQFLRLQVEAMPGRYAEMAAEMARQMAVDSLALLFLLGVRMPDPETGFAESELFLKAIASNHGKMATRAALGTVEEYLADPKRHLRSNRAATQAA